MAATVFSASLTTSAAVSNPCGVSETRAAKPAPRLSSSAGASAFIPLSQLRQSKFRQLNRPIQNARLGRAAVHAALPSSPSSSPASGDEALGVVPSAEWSNNFSYLTYEDLSKYYESAIMQGLEEDSEASSVSPLLPSRSHGVLSGEWTSNVSILSYQDLTEHLQEAIVNDKTGGEESPLSPLLPSRKHGVISGEWDQSAALLSYQDLTLHLKDVIQKEQSQSR